MLKRFLIGQAQETVNYVAKVRQGNPCLICKDYDLLVQMWCGMLLGKRLLPDGRGRSGENILADIIRLIENR